ncbi:LppP/LprE family lipoprotein, partial [Frankia sp. CcWB2]
ATTGPASARAQASASASPTPVATTAASPTATTATLSAADAAATVRRKGYEPDMSTYAAGRRLNVVIGTGQPAGDTPRQLAFVFADGEYRGTDTKAPSAHITLQRQRNDHEVVLRYATYDPRDPVDAPSGHADVRFRWTGTNFSTLDKIPPSDPNVSGSRR